MGIKVLYYMFFRDIQKEISDYVQEEYEVNTIDQKERTLKLLEEVIEYAKTLDISKELINETIEKANTSIESSSNNRINKRIEFYDVIITFSCFIQSHGLHVISAFIKALDFQKNVKNSDKY